MSCTPQPGPTMTVKYGNDKSYPIRATSSDGTSKNMTGYTLVFTVAPTTQTDVYLIEKTPALSTPTQPVKGTLVLTAEDTTIDPGKYLYDSSLWKDGLKESSQIGDFVVEPVLNTDTTP